MVLINPCRIVIVLGPSVWGGEDPPLLWIEDIRAKWPAGTEIKAVRQNTTRLLQIKMIPRPGTEKNQESADKEMEYMKQAFRGALQVTADMVANAPITKPQDTASRW